MDWKALQMATSGQYGQPAQQQSTFGMVGSGMSTPAIAGPAASSPYDYIRANYSHADEAGSTRKIWEEGQRQGWTNEQMGQGLGFTGQQVQDHFAKYGLGQQQPAPNMFGSQQPNMGLPAPVGGQPQGMNPYGGGNQLPGASMPAGPSYARNPFLDQMAGGVSRHAQQFLDRNLSGIRSNAIMAGGYGGSRQGVAEGQAISGAADSLQSNLANMFGASYESDSNRLMQRYGMDLGHNLGLGQLANQASLGWGGLQNQRYATDQNAALGWGGLQNQARGQDMNFYGQQRQQDMDQTRLGAQLETQAIDNQWAPWRNASEIMRPYSGLNSSSSSSTPSDSGWQRALSALFTGASLWPK